MATSYLIFGAATTFGRSAPLTGSGQSPDMTTSGVFGLSPPVASAASANVSSASCASSTTVALRNDWPLFTDDCLKFGIYMLRAIWEFAQSEDRAEQTEDLQNVRQTGDF